MNENRFDSSKHACYIYIYIYRKNRKGMAIRATINLKSFRPRYYSFRVLDSFFCRAPSVDELGSKVRRLVSRRSKSKFDRKRTMPLPKRTLRALLLLTSYGEINNSYLFRNVTNQYLSLFSKLFLPLFLCNYLVRKLCLVDG